MRLIFGSFLGNSITELFGLIITYLLNKYFIKSLTIQSIALTYAQTLKFYL